MTGKYGLEVQGKNTIVDDARERDNVVGVFLDGATGANINDFEAGDNTVYGVWIRGGKGNQVNCFNTDDNTGTGVYIGCHDNDTVRDQMRGREVKFGESNPTDFSSEDNGDAGVVIDLFNQGSAYGFNY